MLRRRHTGPGFTLLEVLITIVLSALLGLFILSVLVSVSKFLRFQKERVVAVNIMANKLEEIKQTLFTNITPHTEGVTMDVANTPDNPRDDLAAGLQVILRDKEGERIYGAPETKDMVSVQLTIRWRSANKDHVQDMFTMLTP